MGGERRLGLCMLTLLYPKCVLPNNAFGHWIRLWTVTNDISRSTSGIKSRYSNAKSLFLRLIWIQMQCHLRWKKRNNKWISWHFCYAAHTKRGTNICLAWLTLTWWLAWLAWLAGSTRMTRWLAGSQFVKTHLIVCRWLLLSLHQLIT